jgi:hypothetical protein
MDFLRQNDSFDPVSEDLLAELVALPVGWVSRPYTFFTNPFGYQLKRGFQRNFVSCFSQSRPNPVYQPGYYETK